MNQKDNNFYRLLNDLKGILNADSQSISSPESELLKKLTECSKYNPKQVVGIAYTTSDSYGFSHLYLTTYHNDANKRLRNIAVKVSPLVEILETKRIKLKDFENPKKKPMPYYVELDDTASKVLLVIKG